MNPTIKARIESIRRGEVPEGYKRTKIGVVPNEWEISKIGSVSERIIPGATPSTSVKEYWGGNIRWMSSGEIHNRFIYNTQSNITKEGYEACSTTLLPTHCVLIALAGQGKTRGCVAVNEVELCTNQSIAALAPKNIHYLYLFFFLESKYLALRSISSGDGTRGGLNISLLNGFQIAIPTNSEQQKIAEILETQDKLIKLQERLIEEYKKLKKYFLSKMFPKKGCNYPEIRFPEFTAPWEQRKFGGLYLSASEGGTPNTNIVEYYHGGTIPFVRIEDTKNKYIVSVKTFITEQGLKHSSACLCHLTVCCLQMVQR